ncbi:methyltransferase [Kitasatospora cineracea]|uniref:methyltransferase n=1 Tax=Kitasatospora cineracea TaxID=88074 RepID=UPI0038251CB7
MTASPSNSRVELDLASDLSSLTTRLPGPSGSTADILHRPVRSLLVDAFPALTDGRADGITVTFGDLQVGWYPDGGTYQLNLDAFRFIDAVSGLIPSGARLLDVGSGTGVLGLGVATRAEVRQVCLLDYNVAAMRQAGDNCRTFAQRRPDVQIRLVQGRFRPALLPRLGEHDVLISNPPYFPPELLRGTADRTRLTDEFGLTANLITDGLSFAAEVYFMYSSAAEPEVAELLTRSPVASRAETVARWHAPFPTHLLTPLGRERFDGVGPDERWDTWHEVRVLRLTRT